MSAIAKLIVSIIAWIVFVIDRVIIRPKKTLSRTVPLTAQSSLIAGPDRIRRALCVGADKPLVATFYERVTTLYENFRRGVEVSGNLPCLGTRVGNEYKWQTYNEVAERLTNFASGLIFNGVEAGQNSLVALYSKNRAEWIIGEQACNSQSMIVVPLYDTLGPDASLFIIRQAGIKTVVVEGAKLPNLLAAVKGTSLLSLVISMDDDISTDMKTAYFAEGITLKTFKKVESEGKANPAAPLPPKSSDIATICYTSGTTGDPKGAMLTHGNLIANVAGLFTLLADMPSIGHLTNDDSLISYLPLAHMFERIMQTRQYGEGARVGFYSGDVLKLTEDMGILKPTIFPAVPRLLNKLYDRAWANAKAAGGIKQLLFEQAYQSKLFDLQQGIIRRTSFWDKLVFGKIQALLGGRVRFMITGAAPISAKVLNFLRCAVGCVFVEGYGQTECTAGANVTVPGDAEGGHVGPPLPCTEIKLFSVLDMGYDAKEDKGEICYRGTNIFRGYLNAPERTREAIDDDGWLHSGDIGTWLPNGTLKIIDRKKTIFKLAQGEYVAPEKIENVLRQPLVAQIFVTGRTIQPVLVAIVVVEPNELAAWAAKNGKAGDVSALIRDADVNKYILGELTSIGQKAGLHSFEQVKAITLTTDAFTVENNMLTPTFKAKRNVMEKHFEAQIDQMYASLAQAGKL